MRSDQFLAEHEDLIKFLYLIKAGFVDGRHYNELVEEIKALKRNNKLVEAENLILKVIPILIAEAKS